VFIPRVVRVKGLSKRQVLFTNNMVLIQMKKARKLKNKLKNKLKRKKR
jgi:hypothetical protein